MSRPITGPFRTTPGLRFRYGAGLVASAFLLGVCSLGMVGLWVEAVVRWAVGQ